MPFSVRTIVWSVLFAASTASAAEVDFNRDVRPILAENCFLCHGPDEGTRKAKLRLDLRDAALKGGESAAPAVVPGKPGESPLVARITSADPDEQMPPPDSKKKLTPRQVETLKRWVESGAKYSGHWAFVAPQRPAVPSVQDSKWPRNDVDQFVLAKLQSAGLHPSAEADKAALLRRLSLDLVGLPPSPQELDAFLADSSPDAYEKQVERLLASPHFGEKWARHWLDAARYADSNGYEKDMPRKQWPWRDWVINAINRDMPYDRFVIEQLAGDLLPSATQDQRVATGFLRNGMVNEEGAILAEQFRMEGLFDRMDAIGKSVLGLTIQCAQCHSHKFDPLTQDEYYGLMAFINNDYEATTWVYSDEQLALIKKVKDGTVALEEKLKREHPDWPQKLAAWEDDTKKNEQPWQPLHPIEHEWVGGLAHPDTLPDDSVLTLGFRPSEGDLWVTADSKTAGATGLRLEALTHGDLPFNGPGRSDKGTFAVSEVVVEAKPAGVKDAKWETVKLTNATADFAEPERRLEEFYRKGNDDKRTLGPASFLIDGKDLTAWGSDPGPGLRHRDYNAVMQFEKPPPAGPEGTSCKVTLRFRHAGRDVHGRHSHFLGRFRLSLTSAAEPKADPLPKKVREALKLAPEKRSAEQQAAVFSAWRAGVAEFKPVNDEIDKLWKQHPEGETVLNLAQRQPEDARQTFLLERGSWQKPTRQVPAGVPAFLHPMPEGATKDRLGLATWLVDRRSPTAARVAVNRVWQAVFGVGFVDTPEDFGTRASDPSQPELLDWLAVEFMERGWSTKQLVRTIVTSSTYRQSSRLTPELLERDPNNRLLARGPRFRAEAEVVRDVALAASGLLEPKVGGPSFYPPVPESMFALSYLDVDFWKVAPAPERYRRSLYVFRRRSMPDPVLSAFDAPNGDSACARRARSNTPLAALTALNEPVMVEAAQAMALRVLRDGGAADAERAAYAFRLCTARAPKPAELNEVVALLQSQRKRVSDGWVSSREVATGDATKLPPVPKGATPTDVAAWTIVSRVLLNLDETVTKN
jgi:mono/diheme cytochrome c family protein